MKYKLIIDKNVEEEIIAIVHAPSSLTQEIENLVCGFSGADSIMGYREEERVFRRVQTEAEEIAVDARCNNFLPCDLYL
mgnify:CR=1 FL=1